VVLCTRRIPPHTADFDGLGFLFSGFFWCGLTKKLQQANGKKRKQNKHTTPKKMKFRALNMVDKKKRKQKIVNES
jgi:hypothetical protein